jgi:threonine dehydrogenase-like Zn-dependent dehydrogenase
VLHGPRDVRAEDVPDPELEAGSDAVVRITHASICGSDLWPYRGVDPRPPRYRIGHEFLGVVTHVGEGVRTLHPGDAVVSPFAWSDGDCPECRAGVPTSCRRGGFWGTSGTFGTQAQAVRVPFADSTLVTVPPDTPQTLMPAVLTLTDVMPTGHHAAVCAGVRAGSTVLVVGDGAVGLSGVLASSRLGADRIILLSRHAERAAIGRRFGATDVLASRGDDAIAAARELTDGLGADAVLECVGSEESWRTSLGAVRAGGMVGFVGAPHGVPDVPIGSLFQRNVGIRGGVAPVRTYLTELLDDVVAGTLDPSPLFDRAVDLEDISDGYAAMDSRDALKVLVQP